MGRTAARSLGRKEGGRILSGRSAAALRMQLSDDPNGETMVSAGDNHLALILARNRGGAWGLSVASGTLPLPALGGLVRIPAALGHAFRRDLGTDSG